MATEGIREGLESLGQSISEGITKRREKRRNESVLDLVELKIQEKISRAAESASPEERQSVLKKQESFTNFFDKLRKSGLDAKDTLSVATTIEPNLFKDVEEEIRVAAKTTTATEKAKLAPELRSLRAQEAGETTRATRQAQIETQPAFDALENKKLQEQEKIRAEAKAAESAVKLGTAVKRLSILNRQFNEALPTYEKGAAEQRVSGKLQAIGAKWGVAPNPKLLALLTNSRPVAINLVRAFGEVGNLSESEQRGALEVVDQSGLTEEERLEKVRQFAEFALAGASTDALEGMMKDKNIVDIVQNLGIKVPGFEVEQKIEKGSKGKLSTGIEFEIL